MIVRPSAERRAQLQAASQKARGARLRSCTSRRPNAMASLDIAPDMLQQLVIRPFRDAGQSIPISWTNAESRVKRDMSTPNSSSHNAQTTAVICPRVQA